MGNEKSLIHPNKELMRELIKEQWEKDSIFAAVISPEGKIMSKGKTTVGMDNDPTSHAEVNAIRKACEIIGVHTLPKGYWLYSTFEPCPLCASAIYGLILKGWFMRIIQTIGGKKKIGHL